MKGDIFMSATHQTLPAAKPSAGLPDPGKQRRFPALRLLRHREMLLALASGALMCTAWGLHAWLPMLSVVLYITAYIVGGFVKAREGLATLFKDRDLDVNLLMIAAALGAASIGYWNEGAMLIFIFALSGALESFAGEQSRRDISALAAMKPETALRIDADGMKEVAAETLLVGDLVLVKPGEVIPADGIVSSGGSSVNQSAITGESMPVDKRAGDGVYAGTINGEGALYVEVTSPADGTLFAKIIALVEQAEREVPKTERFIKRLEGIYAKAVLLVTAALVLLAPLTFGWAGRRLSIKRWCFSSWLRPARSYPP